MDEKLGLIVNSQEYYFQKLENAFKKFDDYKINNNQIDILIDKVSKFYDNNKSKSNKFLKFIEENKEFEEVFNLIGQIISMCDLNASNKEYFNPYDDNRVVAKAGVRQNDWIINLLKYKKNGINGIPPSIKATIEYIKDPINNLTVLSENHKRLISEKLLNCEYSKDTFIPKLKKYFNEKLTQYQIINEKNINIIISNLIYLDEIKSIWLSEKYIEESLKKELKEKNQMLNNTKQIQPLNQILYGSPGTGKTYNTINKALEIIFNLDTKKMSKEEIENALIEKIKNEKILKEIKDENNNREILKDCFEKYKNAGQIEFVTFHQSYGYEEFVEGIKAIPKGEKYNENGTEMIYKVVPGIFKKLCEKASTKADINSLDFGNPNKIWKMSLGESGSKQAKDIRQYCFDNNVIGLGFWISDVKFKGENGNEIFEEMKKEHAQNPQQYPKNTDSKIESANKTSRIKNEMKEGDIVLISGDNLKTISGIAKVTGKYKILSELREDYPDIMKGYEQVREVEWLVKNIDIPVDDYLEEGKQQLGRGTIISNNTINLQKLKALEIKSNTDKNYILIIDEINRGNISKIFGELITLIEPSKRIVADEEIKVKLPYSGDNFGVPQNLYIIGTMNTADRSIAPIDTALRRRFVFEEMAPNPSLLSENIEGVNLQSLLEAINTRIEYLYDRDHTIGHAYLIDVENLNDLIFAFKNKIIPLLAEYFYEDWENIDLVLNQNGFIVPNNENKLYLSEKITKRIQNKITYKVSDNSTWTKEQFISIYKKIENEE